jgi:hypothetical protein
LSDGIAAIIGLSKTSESPAETEKTTVPISSPIYAKSGKNVGISAYINNPAEVISGIHFTVLCKLNRFEKKVKRRSIESCVQKFTRTNVPSNVYEIPYISRNVTKSIGGRLNIDAIVKFDA